MDAKTLFTRTVPDPHDIFFKSKGFDRLATSRPLWASGKRRVFFGREAADR